MTDYIIQHYNSMTAPQIAKELGVPECNVRYYINKLGLSKQVKYDYQQIATMLETMRPIEVAKVTGINVNTIHTIKFRSKQQTITDTQYFDYNKNYYYEL